MSTNNTQYFDISIDDNMDEDQEGKFTFVFAGGRFMKMVQSALPCIGRLSDTCGKRSCYIFCVDRT
uniref:Uncharacterized protein n=1 Tax=viral metagenome TaxID=1070528 RepID=A0A6C0BZX2_9ZZZZ